MTDKLGRWDCADPGREFVGRKVTQIVGDDRAGTLDHPSSVGSAGATIGQSSAASGNTVISAVNERHRGSI